MKNQVIMGSVSTANQSKKGLTLLASFSFIVFACLLAASNGALAMGVKKGASTMDDFRNRYGQMEGYTELSSSQIIEKLERLIQTGDRDKYVIAPIQQEGTNLYVPYIFYDDAGIVDKIALDPAYTNEQIDQEIERLRVAPVQLDQPE
jgi:hypothetical protein